MWLKPRKLLRTEAVGSWDSHFRRGERRLHSGLFPRVEFRSPAGGGRSSGHGLKARQVLSQLVHGERLWQLSRLLHEVVHHLNAVSQGRHGVSTSWRAYLVGAAGSDSSAHALFQACGATADEPVSLECGIILNVLAELRKRVTRRRALCSAQE